jgi:putative Mg2+ transporter-C (MgtC) family protein
MDVIPIVRVLAAALMSLPVGLDREIRGKPAGVRTHILIAAATSALSWLSIDLAVGNVSADPTRIISYVVAGIGFLGAGLIVGVRGRVYGLTTAASAFAVMAIGVLNGSGNHEVAGVLTAVVMLALGPVDWVKRKTYERLSRQETTVHIVVDDHRRTGVVLKSLHDVAVDIRALEFSPMGEGVVLQMTVRGDAEDLVRLRRCLDDLKGSSAAVIESGGGTMDSD